MAERTFKHRYIYADPGPLPVCEDCGATADVDWVEVTRFTDPPGIHRFAPGRDFFKCPNGPHRFTEEEARRG